MKISMENDSKMVLVDNKLRWFASSIAFFFIGLVIAWSCRKNFVPILFGLVFAGVGVFIFYTTRRVNIQLDKAAGKIKISLKGLKRTDQRELAFGDIQKLVLSKSVQTSSVRNVNSSSRGRSSSTYYQYSITFVTNNNDLLAFEFGRVKAGLATLIVSPDTKKQADAQQIAGFIGVPLEAFLPSPVAVLSAIKERFIGGAKASI